MNAEGMDRLDFSAILRMMKDEELDALVAMEPRTVALLLNYWNEILVVQVGFREAPACVVILPTGEIFCRDGKGEFHLEIVPWGQRIRGTIHGFLLLRPGKDGWKL